MGSSVTLTELCILEDGRCGQDIETGTQPHFICFEAFGLRSVAEGVVHKRNMALVISLACLTSDSRKE